MDKDEIRTIWVVQHIDTLIIHGLFTSQEKAAKFVDGSKNMAIVNMQVA